MKRIWSLFLAGSLLLTAAPALSEPFVLKNADSSHSFDWNLFPGNFYKKLTKILCGNELAGIPTTKGEVLRSISESTLMRARVICSKTMKDIINIPNGFSIKFTWTWHKVTAPWNSLFQFPRWWWSSEVFLNSLYNLKGKIWYLLHPEKWKNLLFESLKKEWNIIDFDQDLQSLLNRLSNHVRYSNRIKLPNKTPHHRLVPRDQEKIDKVLYKLVPELVSALAEFMYEKHRVLWDRFHDKEYHKSEGILWVAPFYIAMMSFNHQVNVENDFRKFINKINWRILHYKELPDSIYNTNMPTINFYMIFSSGWVYEDRLKKYMPGYESKWDN